MKAEASNQKIAWFRRENRAKTLDLSPDFQRNPVWTDEQASYLIDTVLCGLPFPEIYLRSKSNSKGETTHEIVDGQQRIRSLLRFGANDLTLVGDEISNNYKGQSFDDLSTTSKEKFWDYSVVVRDLGDASNAEIRDLFRRLNKHSVILNDQELRNARYKGNFITLMEELADDTWWTESRLVTPRQLRRMEDIEFVSELFIGLMAGPQNKKETVNDYYETYDKRFTEQEKHRKHFRDTKALIIDVLPREEIIEWSGKSDFYSLFLAFGSISDNQLLHSAKKTLAAELTNFRRAVDLAKKKDAAEGVNKNVWKYVQAVTRAASDIDRRKTRVDIISRIIDRAIEAVQ
jgi:hypothetical protein